jgi:hypothetical protein
MIDDDDRPWRGYESVLIGLSIGGAIGLVVALIGLF